MIEEILQGQEFVIVTHSVPDGDAVGSVLALSHFLLSKGKKVYLILPDGLPQKYEALLGNIRPLGEIPPDLRLRRPTLICLDSSDLERSGIEGEFGLTVNIDHHQSNSLFGDRQIVQPQASSTGEILAQLLLPEKDLSQLILDCLYLAIYSDTDGFSLSNTSAQTLDTAYQLVRRGADPQVSLLYRHLSQQDLKFLQVALKNLSYDPPIAYSYLADDSKLLSNYDTDFIMNILRLWRDPLVYILFKEVKEGVFKVSMRSRGEFDLLEIARYFGGGGHRQASGCTIKGEFAQVKELLLNKVKEELVKSGRLP